MCVSRTNDPCGFLCIFIMYAAVLYGDYVVLNWILFDAYESLVAIAFHFVLFHVLVVFVLRSHCQAAFRDPGFCVRRSSRRTRHNRRHRSTGGRDEHDDTSDDYLNKFDLMSSSSLPPQSITSSQSSSSSSIIVVQMDTATTDTDNRDDTSDDEDDDNNNDTSRKNWTICMQCQLWRPPRAHHCRVCGRCVRRMDHHCPWINNCVGERNQREFIRFLIAVSLLSGYTIGLVLDTWLNITSPPIATSTSIYLRNLRSLHLNIVFVESILFGLFGFIMFIDQRSLTASDTTTLEKKRNKMFAAATSTATRSSRCWCPNTKRRYWRLLILPCLQPINKSYPPLSSPPQITPSARRTNHKLAHPNYIV